MFTKEQIQAASAKAKSGADYPRLVQDFKSIGIKKYEHIVGDGSNVYYGDDAYSVTIFHEQNPILVSDDPSVEKLKQALSIHQQGKTDYPTFCLESGKAGVEKWVSDLDTMTVSYLDKTGKVLLEESIPTMA